MALATMGILESWHDRSNQVSLLWPTMNNKSSLLLQRAIMRIQHQAMLIDLEKRIFVDGDDSAPDVESR